MGSGAGMLRGHPPGGVAILWRRSALPGVAVVPCYNPRICAIRIVSGERSVLVLSVYMPTDAARNIADFTHCLGTVSAIIDNCNIEDVFVIGGFNAHPSGIFYIEMMNFCNDNKWTCIDIER